MKITQLTMCLAAVLLTSFSAANLQSTTFGQVDLEKMVAELDAKIPHDSRLAYPIDCKIEAKDEINAYATAIMPKDAPKGTKPRATMVVFSGLVTAMKDLRLVRAVVSHELAHLSKGHMFSGINAQDLDLIHTRQQEYEADVIGASALEACGYRKQDAIDMLLALDAAEQRVPGRWKVLGDHGDVARRAANVDQSSMVLRSMVSFQTGEAYYDVKKYFAAMEQFDAALARAPKFYEAANNAARAALTNYYDQLSDGVKNTWYLPDFGPTLARPAAARATTVIELDRKNFAAAQQRVNAMIALNATRIESLEVRGLLLVLDPDGTASNLAAGIADLEAASKLATTDVDRLRIANNLAIGYQRTNNVSRATDTLVAVQATTTKYNACVATNLGRQDVGTKYKASALRIEAVLYSYLTRTSSAAAGYSLVLGNYAKFCASNNLKARAIVADGISLAPAYSINHSGTDVVLLGDVRGLVSLIGKAENAIKYSEDFAGMLELVWNKGAFTSIIEQTGADLTMLRLTSYTVGDSITLRAENIAIANRYTITVGMSVADFEKVLTLASGTKKQFVKVGSLEEWTYFAGLNFAVNVNGATIAGISVTPSIQ